MATNLGAKREKGKVHTLFSKHIHAPPWGTLPNLPKTTQNPNKRGGGGAEMSNFVKIHLFTQCKNSGTYHNWNLSFIANEKLVQILKTKFPDFCMCW